MTDGGYYDYQQVEQNASFPSMNPYRAQESQHNYDSAESKPPSGAGPGFYQDQYGGQMDTGQHGMAIDQQQMTSSTSQDYGSMLPPSALMAAAGSAGAYGITDPAVYAAMKAEGKLPMPPTPPGSPEDPKDLSLHGMGASMAAQHLLAKPVPMRRLSEKRIAQARACLGNVSSIHHNNDPLLDPSLGSAPALAHAVAISQQSQKRPRSEKKPIPDDAKDDKYFDRRKRNNQAAKKSRDARKAREDEIAIRASFLEKENAILRAQVATLREEANSLRQLLLQKRSRP